MTYQAARRDTVLQSRPDDVQRRRRRKMAGGCLPGKRTGRAWHKLLHVLVAQNKDKKTK